MTERQQQIAEAMPGLPNPVLKLLEDLPAGDVCGRCSAFEPERSLCRERNYIVRKQDPGCPWFIPNPAVPG